MKVAIIYPSKQSDPKVLLSYIYFDSEDIDIYYLCSKIQKKILKKDIDLDIDSIIKQYDIVCPVGAETLKYVCKLTGITKYNGYFIENKFLPFIDPNLVRIKPQYQQDVEKAVGNLKKLMSGEIKAEKIEKDYKYIDSPADFVFLLEKLRKAKKIVVDTETTGLSSVKNSLIGIAFSTKPHEGYFTSIEIVEKFKKELKEIFKTKIIIFHNAKFDIQFLKRELGFEFPQYEDTMLLHYCLEEAVGTHGLKGLAMKYTDLGDYERELEVFKKSFCKSNKILLAQFSYDMIPIEILAPYACKDGDATFQIYNKFKPLVIANDKFNNLYTYILMKASKALIILEMNGGPVSIEKLNNTINDYTIDIEECVNEINLNTSVAIFERRNNKIFNPNSVKQLQELFYDIMKLTPLKRTDSGAWSTDAETLEYLDHPLADAILDLRKKSKLVNTYLSNIKKGIDIDERLRSNFNIHGTTSGRLSSSGVINYQNIPRDNKDIKKIFTARPGYKIVQCDLGTAEVYYAAVLSNDEFLQEAFKRGLDFHSYVAKQMFNIPLEVNQIKIDLHYGKFRQISKAITFGIMFQAGPATVAETVNAEAESEESMITEQESKQFINKYFKEAKNLKRYIKNSNDFIELNGFIYSFFGRKRRLPESRSRNRAITKHAIRSGFNFLIQSVASDINLLALIDLMDWIEENKYNKDILPFTIVHDSIVSEVRENLIPQYIDTVRKIIQKDRGIGIKDCPIKVDFEIGPSWGELKEIQ